MEGMFIFFNNKRANRRNILMIDILNFHHFIKNTEK